MCLPATPVTLDAIEKRGRAVASRLIEAGAYQQVDYLRRTGEVVEVDVALQNLRLTATLWNSFFNFGKWEAREAAEGGGAYVMEVRDSAAMPDLAWVAVHARR